VPSCTQWREPPFHINFLPEKLKTYIKRKWKVKRKKKKANGKEKANTVLPLYHVIDRPVHLSVVMPWTDTFPFMREVSDFMHQLMRGSQGLGSLSLFIYSIFAFKWRCAPSVTPKQYKVTLRFCCNCHFIFQLKYILKCTHTLAFLHGPLTSNVRPPEFCILQWFCWKI